jgi:hypothetical protein
VSLWEEYGIFSTNDALKWFGREITKLKYFLEVQAGLERTVVFHHGDNGLETVAALSFDWNPIRRYLEPDIQLVFGSEGKANHPLYAIIPTFRAVVELDVHATAEFSGVDNMQLLTQYLNEINSLMPSVSADRQGEAQKHLRSLIRIIKLAA